MQNTTTTPAMNMLTEAPFDQMNTTMAPPNASDYFQPSGNIQLDIL